MKEVLKTTIVWRAKEWIAQVVLVYFAGVAIGLIIGLHL